MQFLTFAAAAVATFAASAAAAPNSGSHWGMNTRVGFSADLNKDTPLGSLSCSGVFAQHFPRMSPHFSRRTTK